MKRTIAFLLAALLCLELAACAGRNQEPEDRSQATKEAFNNGGRYVKYGDDVYYWEDWYDCFEPSGIWGQFADVPGIRRSMMRHNADGTREGLFKENGYGAIWIFNDRFYLTWLDGNYRQQIFSTTMERGGGIGDAADRRELGPGEIFALDEERGLLIAMEGWQGVLLTIDAKTGERVTLAETLADPLLYDAASATLYYRDFSIGERNIVRLCAVNVTTGKARDVARIDILEFASFEDADAVEFDNVWLEDDGLHVFLSGYGGTGRHFTGCAHLIVSLTGDGAKQYDAGDAPDYSRYALNKPFDMRDIQGYDEYYGWYIRNEKDELAQVLTLEDVAPLGLPGGPYYDEREFGDIGHVEYADGAAYFSIVCGPRNPEEDIGWREAYDLRSMHVYRKDLATEEVEELHFFEENTMRGAPTVAAQLEELHPAATMNFMRFDDGSEEFIYGNRENGYGFEENHTPGCSVWCAVDDVRQSWSATATLQDDTVHSYEVENLGDGNRETVWCAGAGSGVGEAVEHAVTIDLLDKGNLLQYDGFCVVNGYAKTEALWNHNARVKTLLLSVNGKPYGRVFLDDTILAQHFVLEGIEAKSGETIRFRFEIEEIYPGGKYDDTCLTGIEFAFVTPNH